MPSVGYTRTRTAPHRAATLHADPRLALGDAMSVHAMPGVHGPAALALPAVGTLHWKGRLLHTGWLHMGWLHLGGMRHMAGHRG